MKQEIKQYFFNKNLQPQIEVVHLASLTTGYKNLIFIPHRTNFYHIFLFDQCTPQHIVDFKPINIRPFSLLFINKDNVHLFDKTSAYHGRVLIFTDDFFCITDDDRKFLRSTIVFNDMVDVTVLPTKKTDRTFSSFFDQIEKELHSRPDGIQHRLVKNLLHNLLLLAERKKRERGYRELKKGADLDYTLLFKDLLEENYRQIKNVAAYTEMLHVSEKRLNHATSTVLGKSPKEMIDERILLEAKRLLTHTSQSIKEVAFAIGFDEPTNFIKYFRKHTSQTPTEFREHYLR